MKIYGIYNQYAEEWWTNNKGFILEFTTKKDAEAYKHLESTLYIFDDYESTIKEIIKE